MDDQQRRQPQTQETVESVNVQPVIIQPRGTELAAPRDSNESPLDKTRRSCITVGKIIRTSMIMSGIVHVLLVPVVMGVAIWSLTGYRSGPPPAAHYIQVAGLYVLPATVITGHILMSLFSAALLSLRRNPVPSSSVAIARFMVVAAPLASILLLIFPLYATFLFNGAFWGDGDVVGQIIFVIVWLLILIGVTVATAVRAGQYLKLSRQLSISQDAPGAEATTSPNSPEAQKSARRRTAGKVLFVITVASMFIWAWPPITYLLLVVGHTALSTLGLEGGSWLGIALGMSIGPVLVIIAYVVAIRSSLRMMSGGVLTARRGNTHESGE
ncbi:MAG: hypothetical protein Q4A34_00185 [Candidatus Saccharibacteria bacterium]|nr:hypothetical protein [Candidatus Saccharibacteria bacterium]